MPFVAPLIGWAAKSALMQSPIGSFLKMIPRWVWIVLACVGVLLLAYWLHSRAVSNFEADTRIDERNKVDAEWRKKMAVVQQDALAWKHRYETASATLSGARRNSHEEALRRNAALTGSLLAQGPGKAVCGSVNPSVNSASSSSGHDSGHGSVNAGMGAVPDQERPALIALPFDEFIKRAGICDANRIEVNTWRAHDKEQKALYEGLRNRK